MPSACAATLGRERFSEVSRMRRPSPGSHSRLARGMRQFSKASVAVLEARVPILSSVPTTVRPGAPFSTMTALIARLASSMPAHFPNSR
ncbi:hypothetical protein G6F54_014083 [Rhizopus delemar]|nr:hypothetical protein G6F54_014083 [Rhizopus delemar]